MCVVAKEGKKGEKNSHESNAKKPGKNPLLPPGHLQLEHEKHGQHGDQDVGDHAAHGRIQDVAEPAALVMAPVGERGLLPVGGDRAAEEDHGGDACEGVGAHEDDEGGVAPVEDQVLAAGEDAAVEEEDGEFGDALA